MLFYLAKITQAIGLIAIGIGFVLKFPKVMDPKLWGLGILIFGMGWAIDRFVPK